MKRFLLCLSLLSIGVTGMLAQSECLPQNYSIILGGGVSLPHVEGNRNDFFSKNGNRVGYSQKLKQSPAPISFVSARQLEMQPSSGIKKY